jgi:hypothetical protein
MADSQKFAGYDLSVIGRKQWNETDGQPWKSIKEKLTELGLQ